MKSEGFLKIIIPAGALVLAAVLIFLTALPVYAGTTAISVSSPESLTNGNYLTASGEYTYNDSASGSTGSGSVSVSGGTYTLSATNGYSISSSGSWLTKYTATYYTVTVTVTFKNAATAAMTLTYTGSSVTVAAGTDCESEDGTLIIQSGGTFTVSLTSSSQSSDSSYFSSDPSDPDTSSGTFTISEISIATANITTTFQACENGSYTVSRSDGVTFSTGESDTVSNDAGYTYTLTAAADDGYELIGWYNAEKDELLSTDDPYTTEGGITITAVFGVYHSDKAMYYILGYESVYYKYFDMAIDAAGSSGTIVLYQSGTVYGSGGETEFTIPSGVTLLLPYAEGATSWETGTDSDDFTYANYADSSSYSGFLNPSTSLYLYLTVDSGTDIYVNGKVIVGGTLCTEAESVAPQCVTAGSHSNLVLDGNLYLYSGAVLSVCGYVLGEGQVTAYSGADVYETFSVLDFGGGSYTLRAAGAVAEGTYVSLLSSYFADTMSGEEVVMPFTQYTMQNIQADLRIEYGADLIGYACLYAGDQSNRVKGFFISAESDSVIILSSGAAADCSFDDSMTVSSSSYTNKTKTGRSVIEITGGASLGGMELDVAVSFGITVSGSISTTDVNFMIPYNYEIHLYADDEGNGTYTISNDLSLLPGSVLEVGEGAVLNINSVFAVYDGLADSTAVGTTYSGPVGNNYQAPTAAQLTAAGYSATAEFIVNGTLNINSGAEFGGLIQTELTYSEDNGYPVINVNSSATLSCTVQKGVTDEDAVGGTVRTLYAWIMDSEADDNETKTTISAGNTYYGVAGDYNLATYDYTVYKDGETATDCSGTALGEDVVGTWSTEIPETEVISWEASFGDLSYGYSVSHSWSGSDLMYHAGDDGEWTSTGGSSDDGTSAGTLVISNTGNVDLVITVSFTAEGSLGWTPSLGMTADDGDSSSGTDSVSFSLPAPEDGGSSTVTVSFSVSGTPASSWSGSITLGSVTITAARETE